MGNLLINLPNLGYCSPLQKIDHIDKCLWYFYTHPVAVTAVNLQPNHKRCTVMQLPILTFGLVALARGFKIGQR